MVCVGMNIKWDHFVSQYDAARYVPASDGRDQRHIQFVREFASVVSVLQVRPLPPVLSLPSPSSHDGLMVCGWGVQDKTNSVIDLYKDILRAVEDLATCAYQTEVFADLLSRIQAAVCPLLLSVLHTLAYTVTPHAQIDKLNLEGYANLEHWVAELDKKIEAILLQRLSHIIALWCHEFDKTDDGDTRRDAAGLITKKRGDKRRDEKVRFSPFPYYARLSVG